MCTSTGYLCNRQLAAAFAAWLKLVPVLSHKRQVMQRAMLYMTHAKLKSAWSAWELAVAGMSRKRQLVQHALAFLSHRTQALALEQWRAAVLEAHQDVDDSITADAFYKRHLVDDSLFSWHMKTRKNLKKRLATRLAEELCGRRLLWAPFVAWRNLTARIRLGMDKLKSCVFKMMQGILSSAFLGWHDAAAKQLANKKLVQRSLSRLMRSHQAAGFQVWRDVVHWRHLKVAQVSHTRCNISNKLYVFSKGSS